MIIHHHEALTAPFAKRMQNIWICFEQNTGLAYDVFGPEHILFGSNAPMDASRGKDFMLDSRKSVEDAGLSKEDGKKIFGGNDGRADGKTILPKGALVQTYNLFTMRKIIPAQMGTLNIAPYIRPLLVFRNSIYLSKFLLK